MGAYLQGLATMAAALVALGVSIAPILLRESRLRDAAIQLAAYAVGALSSIGDGLRTVGLPPSGQPVTLALASSTWELPLAALRAFPHTDLGNPLISGRLRIIESAVVSSFETRTMALAALQGGATIEEVAAHFDRHAALAQRELEELALTTGRGRRNLESFKQSRRPPRGA